MKKDSINLRLVFGAIIVFILIIPLVMIQSLISERQNYRDEAAKEVSQSWASNLTRKINWYEVLSSKSVGNKEV